MSARWLPRYFGSKYMEQLQPTIVFDGVDMAVVKIRAQDKLSSGLSRNGYILVKKNGSHDASPHKSLFEGTPTRADMDAMKKALSDAEGSST